MATMASRLHRTVALARLFSSTSSTISTRSSAPALVEKMLPSGHFNQPPVLPFRFTGARFFSDLDFGSDSTNSFTTVVNGKTRSTLFEGTDYNHWLVTMEFPDPQPTKEEKIAAFERTLANVVGRDTTWGYAQDVIGPMDTPGYVKDVFGHIHRIHHKMYLRLEEAKKRIYIICTTVYTGFKCQLEEELTETMEKQPGVTWVLPDSYADPKTKTYGGTGDRYNMGVLTPDPNANSYNRPSGRYNDRPMNRRRDSLPLERNDRRRDFQPMDRGQGYGSPPIGGRQEYRPPVSERAPLPPAGQQAYRPVGESGPIPSREPIQGQQEDVTGAQVRDPRQALN